MTRSCILALATLKTESCLNTFAK
uniref:Uncharacterized protein n=1 Tax=Anguilla anguilla TaxID=7936 RepID=A0A0E9XK80_ANGAN